MCYRDAVLAKKTDATAMSGRKKFADTLQIDLKSILINRLFFMSKKLYYYINYFQRIFVKIKFLYF